MKIGILSMQRIINYGSFLQAYALKKTIENLGHFVSFVDYHIEKPIESFDNNKKKNRIARFLSAKNKIGLLRLKLFSKKFKSYFPILGFKDGVYHYNTSFDTLVIGSDEVFNCFQNSSLVGYSLELFGKNHNSNKLISYAASFGNTTLNKIQYYKKEEELKKLLLDFDSVSVRDLNSYNIVKQLCDREPEVNIDPVLLYDFVGDEKFAGNCKKTTKSKYLIVYAYSYRLKENECKSIKEFAKKKKLKIFTIGGIQKIGKYIPCSPFEVFDYFQTASFILTDTFHGTIFSIINGCNFATIIRKSNGNSYGNEEKLTYLLKTFDLKERIISDLDDLQSIIDKKIDFENVNKIIKHEREKSVKYLLDNL